MTIFHRTILRCAVLIALACPAIVRAQPAPATRPVGAGGALVTMDFPAEGIEVRTLADIVTKRLKIPIIYDEAALAKRVIIRVPRDVPEGALLGILQSALKMKQLALVDAEQPGWKQIVAVQNLASGAKAAPTTGPAAANDAGVPVIKGFTLEHTDPGRAAEAVRPYLTTPGGSVQPVQGQRVVIVTDYPSVVARAGDILRMLDSDGTNVQTRFIAITHADAGQIVTTVTQLLNNAEAARFGNTTSGVFLAPDERTNQVAVVAPAARMAEVSKLITDLDRQLDLQTKVYRLRNVPPERVDRLVKDLLGASAKHGYQSSLDRESQSLIVAATADVLARVDAVVKELDVPVAEAQSPLRFYKLKNTRAADVLSTINGLFGDANAGGSNAASGAEASSPAAAGAPFGTSSFGGAPLRTTGNAGAASTSGGNVALGMTDYTPGASTAGSAGTSLARPGASDLTRPNSDVRFTQGQSSAGQRFGGASSGLFPSDVAAGGAGVSGVRTANATVTADANTNSIIVIAPPAVQQQYAELIKKLDQRRPQVQIEATIVTLNTSDNFRLAVDIGRLGGSGASKVITFSSFGVSTADPLTGRLTPAGGTGGNFALLSSPIADIVLQALSSNTHARLVSAPQLLVNDNGKGRLESVSQQPFAEILDTAAAQSRTGLGGQAQAGTTISVEPHISEGDYLQLSYSVELSNFTGAAAEGLPPPSEKNAVDSTVTIPDGYTIVVGGLSVKNFTRTIQKVPILGDIPGLGLLFGSRNRSNNDSTLFVFIRPLILRDDKFEDLKYLSDRTLHLAELPGDFPVSTPIPLK